MSIKDFFFPPEPRDFLGRRSLKIALLLLDLHESCVFLLQVRGYLVILKIAVLGLVPRLDPTVAAWVLGVLVVVSVLSSHAPSRVRYAVPIGGSAFRGARTKG
ncbi:MAG: hypothetical protein GTN89_06945 [Acidobacteria bacterium]|nr:hypothetical protein [Acidobacteriota bacterium]NIM62758.1 hypothetical protein [Acidobacteriota bacterium]NIO59058.1 hypothetical protein [Acidobacteriota bacterium]NIQ30097.1 hypothetical protein [Acidobacteriota bacterium]NIQ84900.1 hypothetical protein [Acidobacteriota bacterium]